MLRRQPTKITLNQDDIIAYDTRKAEKDAQKRKQEILQAAAAGNNSSDSHFNQPDPFLLRKDARSRDQRIGL